MNARIHTARLIPAITVSEGAGVTVHRTIGTPALRHHDPFLMLDHFSSDDPADYIAGFPSHPHRGFITFTYMIDGHLEHKDSMGNTGNLGPGYAQWMKAASGIIHSEMPKQENGLMRGFQVWINLHAAYKMDNPEYQEYSSAAFPRVETNGYNVKVLIGRFADQASPIQDDTTHVVYLDVELKAGKRFQLDLPEENNTVAYVFEGNGQINGQDISRHNLFVAGTDDHAIDFTAGEQGARFIVISGQPVNEPIVQHGPFVMNTREEIEQAAHDYHTNRLVRDRANVQSDH